MAIESPETIDREILPIEVDAKVTESASWSRELEIVVAASEVDKAFDKVAREFSRQIRLPGFRPGKVPPKVAEKKFTDDINQRVKAEVIERAFKSALDKEKLEIVGTPSIDLATIEVQRGKDLSFEVAVEIKPVFEVGKYKGLQVEQEEVEVFPEEIDAELDRIAERLTEFQDAAEGTEVQERDVAEGVLVITLDGAEIRREAKGALLWAEDRVLGAFADLGADFLRGAKVGDKKTVEAPLSDKFPQSAFRGMKAQIDFEITRIRRPSKPEIGDELAVKVDAKDLATLKERISSELRKSVAAGIDQSTKTQIFDQILEHSPFELPKRLVETHGERLTQNRQRLLAQYGLGDRNDGRMDQFLKNSTEDAQRELQRFFILEKIALLEKINVTDEEVDEEVVRQARSRNMRAAELFDRLEEEDGMAQLRMDLQSKKVIDFLVENAEIKVVPRKKPHVHGPDCDHDHDHDHVHGPDCDHDHDHSTEDHDHEPAS